MFVVPSVLKLSSSMWYLIFYYNLGRNYYNKLFYAWIFWFFSFLDYRSPRSFFRILPFPRSLRTLYLPIPCCVISLSLFWQLLFLTSARLFVPHKNSFSRLRRAPTIREEQTKREWRSIEASLKRQQNDTYITSSASNLFHKSNIYKYKTNTSDN